MNLIFVCTGNTCRSPMAEGLFKKLLKERNINDIDCSSAGLAAYDGSAAAPNAIAAAEELGADISAHSSRLLTSADALNADLIVCMTQEHCEVLRTVLPEEKISLLGCGINDPYGGDIDVYRACAKKIEQALTELLEELVSKGK